MQSIDERIDSGAEVFRSAMDACAEEIRVALPGMIQAFDEQKQTATVLICLREQISQSGEMQEMEIPPLLDVPVYFPGGADFNISFPVLENMECLVIFSDMCIDAWWESGGVQNQTENRRHDLSDGFALVGFRSQQQLAPHYKNDAIVLQAKESLLEISAEKIHIESENIELQAKESIKIQAENSISIQANLVDINSVADLKLSASEVRIDGELIINDEPYRDHQHGDVKSGTDSTGGIL